MSTEKFLERLKIIARGNYKDLARRSNILTARMQRLKGGVEPPISIVIALAKAGGVSVQWLATGEETQQQQTIIRAEPKISHDDPISAERLEEALEAVDEFCTEYRVALDRSRKVQAAVLIYEIFVDLDRLETDHPDDRTRRRAKVVRLLRKLGSQTPDTPDEEKSVEE